MELTKATLAGGCFWCLEAVYQRIEGIHRVVSGYTGGHANNPDYRSICSGMTGHAEVVQLDFYPDIISYIRVLDYFWRMHDPTTLNRQENDVGTQYRSAIFVHSEEQQELAIKSKQEVSPKFSRPIVTEIVPLGTFYPAEDDHQNYYRQHPENPYCQVIITPKLQKLELP